MRDHFTVVPSRRVLDALKLSGSASPEQISVPKCEERTRVDRGTCIGMPTRRASSHLGTVFPSHRGARPLEQLQGSHSRYTERETRGGASWEAFPVHASSNARGGGTAKPAGNGAREETARSNSGLSPEPAAVVELTRRISLKGGFSEPGRYKNRDRRPVG